MKDSETMVCKYCGKKLSDAESMIWVSVAHTYVCQYCARSVEAAYGAVKLLSDAVNGGSHTVIAEAIVDALAGTHRTLQQDVIRTLLQVLHRYGKTATSDLRNEGAVSVCKAFSKHAEADPSNYYLARI